MEPGNSNSSNPKRVRKCRARVKSGCSTCKSRHLKCDEGRPSCSRCLRYGIPCGGYGILDSTRHPSAIPRSFSLPKRPITIVRGRGLVTGDCPSKNRSDPDEGIETAESQAMILSKGTSHFQYNHKDSPLSNLSIGPNWTESEFRYFSVYREKTAVELGGFSDDGLWTRLLLQECYLEPYAQYALVALGAMDKAADFKSRSIESNADDQYVSHYQFALRQYSKALAFMRRGTDDNDERNLRRILISSLIIICFETFHGDQDLGAKQASTAIKLLCQWLIKNQRTPNSTTAGIKPATRHIVDEKLITIFSRMHKSVLLFRDDCPNYFDGVLVDDAEEELSHMPATFRTIDEATEYWYHHLNRLFVFNPAPGYDLLTSYAFAKVPLDIIAGENTISQDAKDIRTIISVQQKHLDTIACWEASFSELWQQLVPYSRTVQRCRALVLHLQVYTSKMVLVAATEHEETFYDSLYPDFRNIISLCRELLVGSYESNPYQNKPFSFTVGLISSLFALLMKCRYRKLRDQALALLVKYPRKEGTWDTEMVIAIGRWVMEKEETDLREGEVIVEKMRLRVMSVKCPGSEKVAWVKYTMMNETPRNRRMMPLGKVIW